MKLAEFKKIEPPRPVVEATEPLAEEAQFTTSTTPSGIEVYYSWAPRRHYKLRQGFDEDPQGGWREAPSVTTVLGVLDKSGPLTWWGQKVGVEGVMELVRRGAVHPYRDEDGVDQLGVASEFKSNTQKIIPRPAEPQEIVDLLTAHRISVNHVKDSAADRGVNVHGALETWAESGIQFHPDDYPENERGYISGLISFLVSLQNNVGDIQQELMVGSLEHQYAGRFDLVLTLDKPVEVVTRHYPKRKAKVEEIPAGRYLMDLKTRKKASVYNTNYLQLEAYEHAAVECGYAPTDYRAVIVVTEDGGYQVSVNQDWCFEDFLAVRKTYQVLNEREALRILREELDAKEVA